MKTSFSLFLHIFFKQIEQNTKFIDLFSYFFVQQL